MGLNLHFPFIIDAIIAFANFGFFNGDYDE
jgi:hypothetical protein